MIKITSKSVQDEIIQELFSQVSHKSPLFIELESLPYFLSSVPSLKVFLFKIQNYPREVFWYSYSEDILHFLSQNSIKIEYPYNSQNAITTTLLSVPTVIDLNKQNRYSNSNSQQDHFEKLSKLKSKTNESYNINSQETFGQFIQKNNEKIDFKQDLDSWLEKIENTKESLSKFKNDTINENKSKKTNLFNLIFDGKWVYRVALSLFIIIFVAGSILYFPTNTYKVDIAPNIKQESFDLQFSDSAFTKNRYKIQTNNDIESSGANEVKTAENRSIGRVTLINTSATDINFKKEGFVLISEDNGLEYKQKAAENSPAIFTVRAKNNLSNQPLEIDIQASLPGENFNLPEKSSFRVYNNRGEAFGGAVKAITITQIQNTLPVAEKKVSEGDLSLLRSKAEESINNLKLQKLDILESNGEIVNNNWIKETSETSYNYSGKVGETLPKVTIDAEVEIDVYSIPAENLKNLILTQVKVGNISDLQIVDTKIEENQIYAKLFLSFKQNPTIPKNDVIGNLANSNLDQGTLQLQEKYPNIKRVSKDFTGIKLPLITPRSKVEVNELNVN
jgi:hypothetical protein